MNESRYDVAIIGGGPAGSTAGTLLCKYKPELRVLILEREVFPREHVGESQLPPISRILDEMGCWEQVEAAGFPIKIGATYRWGSDPALWDFEFLPLREFHNEPRPARYAGQRLRTAFQVERSVYDDILLRQAQQTGCTVRQGTRVSKVLRDGDRVTALQLDGDETVTARYYIDASGGPGILRRAMGVAVDTPTTLQNIAIWDYWENAEWAVEIGVGGTRVQVMSIGNGWLWFIPLSPTRTSIGFICPAAYYKASGTSPETLYLDAIAEEPLIRKLTENASRAGAVRTTRDWSFLAQRMAGANWFLAGESAGFADPILAAGMTLAHSGAREVAYTLLELDRGEHDGDWLRERYQEGQQRRIGQHIRFADFWYAANGQFTDLQDYTRTIAQDAGLDLSPQAAFQWLGTGGFTNDVLGQVGIGGLDLAGVQQITQRFTGGTLCWELSKYNRFKLQLADAQRDHLPILDQGRIRREPCYLRDGHVLPVTGLFALLIQVLQKSADIADISKQILAYFSTASSTATPQLGLHYALQVLEVMLSEGWVKGTLDPRKARLKVSVPEEGDIVHANRDIAERLKGLQESTMVGDG